ncbi:MAG: DUF58 domain-containing protein [Luteolibacter sp.]
MIPTSRLLWIASGWLVAAFAVVAWSRFAVVWWWLGAVMGAVVVLDFLVGLARKPVRVSRRLPGRFAMGQVSEVRLQLSNDSKWPKRCEVFDGVPPDAVADGLPWRGLVPAGRHARVFHPVKLMDRGVAKFGPVQVRTDSLLGLWQKKSRHLETEEVKVYPNYEPVIRFALLAMQHRENPLGIVRRPRAGTSRDFQQLRDYRDGDPMAQIDWKATSRRQALISRDYQEQRNQSIVFLLDTGRRMRAMDGELPQFEHVLNALLLVAHVALKQGDQVAVKSFGGTDRWLPPIKGAHAMPVLLNHLYDYQTTAAPSDFSGAVEQLMARQQRRSLVILLTNLRGEDGKELIPALQVLQSRHVLLLASMREKSVDETFQAPVMDFSHALRYLAADHYVQERREVQAALGAAGIFTLDTIAQSFAVDLANRYLDIKSSGRI